MPETRSQPGEPSPRTPPSAGGVVQVRRLGRVPYREGEALQEEVVRRRRSGEIPDQLLLLEHPHVITLGTGSRADHVLADPERRDALGVELVETGRGGDVTYHGPGQLVGYPILALEPERRDLHRYLRDLEAVLLEVVGGYGVHARRVEGFTGVWTGEGKIGAIGVRVSSGWLTSHGFALNVATNLDYFTTIVPCGLADRTVTSLERLLDRPVSMEEVMDRTAAAFSRVFGRSVEEAAGPP